MIRAALLVALLSGCGFADAGLGTDANGSGGTSGSGGSGGQGGGVGDAPSSDGAVFDGGGTGGAGGSGGSGGSGDAGPPCNVTLQVPTGPFIAGEPITLGVAFAGPGNPVSFDWMTSQGSFSGTGAMVTLSTTTEGTYLVRVTVFTDLNGNCTDMRSLDVQPSDPRYVRLRVTPPTIGAPRQAHRILPPVGAQSVAYDIALDPGAAQSLSIISGAGSVAGYLRFNDRMSCVPIEAYPTATAAASMNLPYTPFDVLVIPADSQLAPILYPNHTGPDSFGVLPGTAVGGQVLDSSGAPIAGAHVELTNGVVPSSIAVTRASDGGFEAHTLTINAALDLVIAPPDSSLPIVETQGTPIAAVSGTPPPLVFSYDAIVPAHVSGTVTLPGGGLGVGAHVAFVAHQPFARVGQLAIGAATPIPVGGTARAETITGVTSSFGPIALPPAVYDVLVEAPTGPIARLRTTVDLTQGDRTLALHMGPLVTLSGTVTDANGQPVMALVRAVERGASATYVLPQPQSAFDLQLDPGATYDVYATPDPSSGLARVAGTIDVPIAGAQIALVAHPGVTFQGTITQSTTPVAGAVIEAMLGADCSISTTVVADTLSGRDGTYRIVVPVP